MLENDEVIEQAEEMAAAAAAVAVPSAKVDVEQVRLRVLQLTHHNDVTQAQISRETGDGVSSGTLSAFLKGSYKGDPQAVAQKLARWLAAREVKTSGGVASAMRRAPEWVKTEIGERLLKVCTYAQGAGDFAVIHGGAGLGKTTALKRYAALNNNAWHIEMSAASGRMLASLNKIAQAIGSLRHIQRPAWIIERIVQRLTGTGGLLMIDEAQHLDLQSLESIRAIHDATEAGVVLSGNTEVYSRIHGNGSRAAEFAQLFSRIGQQQALTRPSVKDVNALAAAWGISGKAECAFLQGVASKPGALRAVTKVLRMAWFQGGDIAPNEAALIAAFNHITRGEA